MKPIIDNTVPNFKSDPADDYVPVTTSDTDALPDGPCRGLLVGTAGTANLVTVDGTLRASVPLVQGYNPLVVLQIKTGGTASNIFALY